MTTCFRRKFWARIVLKIYLSFDGVFLRIRPRINNICLNIYIYIYTYVYYSAVNRCDMSSYTQIVTPFLCEYVRHWTKRINISPAVNFPQHVSYINSIRLKQAVLDLLVERTWHSFIFQFANAFKIIIWSGHIKLGTLQ